MKAIFAVSALAAAISAQALAADTEATTTFAGSISYETTFELDTPDRSMSVGDESLSMDISVANGGFSGTLSFVEEGDDDDGADPDNVENEISVSDLQYAEGAFLFGQGVGSIMSTAGAVGNMDSTMDFDASDAFRYTSDLGLTLQLEVGDDDWDEDGDTDDQATDFGVAVAYMTELDVATVTVDAQVREFNAGAGDEDTMADPYVGAKAVAAVTDMVTITAGLSYGGTGAGKFDDAVDAVVAYGAQADVAVMEGVTAAAYYSTTDTNNEVGVSASATFAPLTVTASHTMQLEAETATTEATAALSEDFAVSDAMMVNAHAEASWETDADVDWSAGVNATYMISEMLKAYAGYELDTAGDGTEAIASLTYTTEGGAALSATYTNRNDIFDADDSDAQNDVVLKAAYSF
jgi:hypothetical protein